MSWEQGMFLGAGCTIAVRYSAIRRQGRIDPNAKEVQILDYQTQQHRLFPQIARAYAFLFASVELLSLYQRTLEGISKGNADLLPDLHALTSGFKSTVTHYVGQGLEQCRMACGGHGYSLASGLPQIYTVQIGGCTYEGENMVMLLQVARYLVKAVGLLATGQPLSVLVSYLDKKDDHKRSLVGQIGSEDEEVTEMVTTMEHATRRVIFEAAKKVESLKAGGVAEETAWNASAVELTRAARLHTRLFIATIFAQRVRQVVDAGIRQVLKDVLLLHLHYELVDMAHHLLEDGFVTGDQISYLKKGLYEDLARIRPNAVSLVDSFDVSERELNSVLGRRDGNVYEALYAWAKKSELNRTEVLPAYHKYLKPIMETGKALSKL